MTTPAHFTSQQANWFVAVKEGLERDGGMSLDQWIEIARSCPETQHRARLKWFKSQQGLGMNRASLVLSAAFKSELSWNNPENLLDQVRKTPETRAVYEKVETIAKSLGDDVIISSRKNLSAFSRRVQFTALRPTRAGVRLGVAIPLNEAGNCLAPMSSDCRSDRLTAVRFLSDDEDVADEVEILSKRAYESSGYR